MDRQTDGQTDQRTDKWSNISDLAENNCSTENGMVKFTYKVMVQSSLYKVLTIKPESQTN